MAAASTLSRRALVAGAAVSALAGPAAAAQNPDAALLDLGRRFTGAIERWEAAQRACTVAYDHHRSPEPPEALFRRREDTLSTYGLTKRNDRRWYGDEIESLRSIPYMVAAETPDGSRSAIHIRSAREMARRDDIVAAYDAWQSDMVAAREASGVAAAEAALEAASEATRAFMEEIAATPTTTLAGVMVKARAAGWVYGGLDGIAYEIEEEAAGTGESMMFALLHDLLRLAGSGALPAA